MTCNARVYFGPCTPARVLSPGKLQSARGCASWMLLQASAAESIFRLHLTFRQSAPKQSAIALSKRRSAVPPERHLSQGGRWHWQEASTWLEHRRSPPFSSSCNLASAALLLHAAPDRPGPLHSNEIVRGRQLLGAGSCNRSAQSSSLSCFRCDPDGDC